MEHPRAVCRWVMGRCLIAQVALILSILASPDVTFADDTSAAEEPSGSLLASLMLKSSRSLLPGSRLTLRHAGGFEQLRLERVGREGSIPMSTLWLVDEREAEALIGDLRCVAEGGRLSGDAGVEGYEPASSDPRRWLVELPGDDVREELPPAALVGEAADCVARVAELIEQLALELPPNDLIRAGGEWRVLRLVMSALADVVIDGRYFPAERTILEIPIRAGEYELQWWLPGEVEARLVRLRVDPTRTTLVRLE